MIFKKYMNGLRIKILIKHITRQLFSEEHSLLTEEDRKNFILQFSKNKSKIQILTIYLALIIINKKTLASATHRTIEENDINELFDEINKYKEYFSHKETIELANDVLNSEIELNYLKVLRELRLRGEYYEIMRKRSKDTPYTFEVQRYIREKAKKRPLSISEQNACKKFVDEISQFDKEIEDLEMKYDEHISNLEKENSSKH